MITQTLRSLHGNKVGPAIEELHRAENDLAGALLTLSDQQKVDHEIFYVARDIAGWSQQHVRRLAAAAWRPPVTTAGSTSTPTRRTSRRCWPGSSRRVSS